MADVKGMFAELQRADIAAVKVAKIFETGNLNIFAITELLTRIIGLCIEASETPLKAHVHMERMISVAREDARLAYKALGEEGYDTKSQPLSVVLALSLMINRNMVMKEAGLSDEEAKAYNKKLAENFDVMINNVIRGFH